MQDLTEFTRRIEILSRVLNDEIFSKSDLTEMFSVSEITISRDLRYLRSEGIPLYSKNKKLVLTDNFPMIEKLLAKYISTIPKETVIQSPIKVERLRYLNFIVYCNQAISNSKGISMRYSRLYNNQESDYKVIPKCLNLIGYNWSLSAVDQSDGVEKQFYISRIKAIKSFELNKKRTKVIRGSNKIYYMHFRFTKEVAEQIKSKIWFENSQIKTLDDGKVDLFFESEISDKLAGWCVSWWDQIEIISPTELKEYLKEMIKLFLTRNP